MRRFLLGAGWVFLLVIDLWSLAWWVVVLVWLLGEGDGEIYVPGVLAAVGLTAALISLNVRIGRRVAANLRGPSVARHIR